MYDGRIDAIIQCEVIMANESMGLLGYKVGMTQIYNSNNAVIPVTVINVSSNTVLQVKSEDGKDGYNALQVGIGERKEKHTSKPMLGVYNKLEIAPKKDVQETFQRFQEAPKRRSERSGTFQSDVE